MSIKIKIEKTMNVNGERKNRLSIDGMYSTCNLPTEYYKHPGSVWVSGMSLYVHTDNQERTDQYRNEYPENKTCIAEYLINYDISPELAEYLIRKIQEGGENLHRINIRIKRERALYEGTSEIII